MKTEDYENMTTAVEDDIEEVIFDDDEHIPVKNVAKDVATKKLPKLIVDPDEDKYI
jgi:hypothetical protein